jgi:hypothetical protein
MNSADLDNELTDRSVLFLVKEHVEMIWDDPAGAEEFRAPQEMLAAYEFRARNRHTGQSR